MEAPINSLLFKTNLSLTSLFHELQSVVGHDTLSFVSYTYIFTIKEKKNYFEKVNNDP